MHIKKRKQNLVKGSKREIAMRCHALREEDSTPLLLYHCLMLPAELVSGGGIMGDLIRAYDWENTDVGPISQWPPNLLNAVSIMLSSKYSHFSHILLAVLQDYISAHTML